MRKWGVFFISCLIITAYFHQGKKINGVIWSDQEGYYIYLPGVFVNGGFKDLPCTNGCSFLEGETGTYTFTKYTYGVALMESPFFLVAHLASGILGFERDGRSLPYIWSVMVAAIFYMLAGLWLIAKLLAAYNFNRDIRWLVPLGLLLGTNLFYYTFREAGMSHVYSFFLFSVLLYSTHRYFKKDELRFAILGAVSAALMIIIRPTNAIALVVPVLWGASGVSGIILNVKRLITKPVWVMAFLVSLIVLALPQIAYWKSLTGDYIFYSYGNEGFSNWAQPKMLQVLFSPQNGWLVYSPVAFMGILGMVFMALKKHSGWVLPWVLLTFATYVFGSWWAWWFGGAYGHRCYVDFLPLLALPAAYAVQYIQQSGKLVRTGFIVMFILAIFVNIRMSDIYQGLWDGPNWTWYSYLGKLKEAFYLY